MTASTAEGGNDTLSSDVGIRTNSTAATATTTRIRQARTTTACSAESGRDSSSAARAPTAWSGALAATASPSTTSADSTPTQRDVIAAGDGAIAFQGAGRATGDVFDLRDMDADLTTPAFVAFTFGGTGKGHLSLADSGTSTLLRGNLDDDRSFEFQVLIDDGDVRAADYTADDFLLTCVVTPG